MTEEQNKILYNIGMNLECRKMHLCPRKDVYEYAQCWMYDFKKNDIKMQIYRKTGKERITLPYTVTLCSRYNGMQRVEMVPCICHDDSKKDECRKKIEVLNDVIDRAISMISIEKTRELDEHLYNVDIPMADFVDMFDERAMFIHFRSLFQCLLDEIWLGNSGVYILEKINSLLDNWNWVYTNRVSIVNQIESYMNLTIEGLELIGCDFPDISTRMELFCESLQKKEDASDILSFFCKRGIDREKLSECLTVLYRFVEKHIKLCPETEMEAKKLLSKLESYINKDLQIETVKELRKIDLNSDKTEKANAKIIEHYLKNNIRYLKMRIFERIA